MADALKMRRTIPIRRLVVTAVALTALLSAGFVLAKSAKKPAREKESESSNEMLRNQRRTAKRVGERIAEKRPASRPSETQPSQVENEPDHQIRAENTRHEEAMTQLRELEQAAQKAKDKKQLSKIRKSIAREQSDHETTIESLQRKRARLREDAPPARS